MYEGYIEIKWGLSPRSIKLQFLQGLQHDIIARLSMALGWQVLAFHCFDSTRKSPNI